MRAVLRRRSRRNRHKVERSAAFRRERCGCFAGGSVGEDLTGISVGVDRNKTEAFYSFTFRVERRVKGVAALGLGYCQRAFGRITLRLVETAFTAYGDRGLLFHTEDELEREALNRSFAEMPPPGYVEHVWGYDTVLVVFSEIPPETAVRGWLGKLRPSRRRRHPPDARSHEVPVHYNGPDLEAVAEAAGMEVEAVIDAHLSGDYRVRMIGFAPGFPYLDGLDARLRLDRRGSPRNRIAPGSVAIGGPHAGIYPVASPGGWHILGHTDLPVFQPDNARGEAPDPRKVFTFFPGDQVRFTRAD